MLNRGLSAVAKAASSGKKSQRLSLVPGRRSSLLTGNVSLNRSLQSSQVIEENQVFSVTCYDSPLPVQVTEAITLTLRPDDMTVKLDCSGWAWMVSGRRLFVWKYRADRDQRFQNPRCYELTLPPSDLAHRADLVCVFQKDPGSVPSCLAVSPEGAVRYWPSVTRETVSTEFSMDLYGQECYSLTNIQPLGCVLATTTGTLVLVTPSSDGRDNTVTSRNLRTAQSLFSGIGRRMATLIFGSSQNQSTELHLVRVLAVSQEGTPGKCLLVLGGSSLQKWTLSESGAEKLIYECDVDWLCAEKFAEALQVTDTGHANEMKTWIIDMQVDRKDLVVFAAAVDPHQGRKLRFACGVLDSSALAAPAGFRSFTVLEYTEPYYFDNESFLDYRLLLPAPDLDTAFVHRDRILLCVSPVGDGCEVVDKIESDRLGGKIIGSGSCDGAVLLFSHKDGVLSVTTNSHNESRVAQLQTSTRTEHTFVSESLNLTASNAQLEALVSSKDPTEQLRAAFLHSYMKNAADTVIIVDRLLTDYDADSLSAAVMALSGRLVDDFPAADPRWSDVMSQETLVTTSLIILRQLEDKLSAHRLYVEYLRDSPIWEVVGQTTTKGPNSHCMATLLQNEEKLVAARVVKNLHSQHAAVLDPAVKMAVVKRKAKLTGKLTNQDVFYREVSKVDDVFESLLEYEGGIISTEYTAQTQVTIVSAVSAIFLSVLSQVGKYRQARTRAWEPDTGLGQALPWASSSGPSGIKTLTIKQYEVTVNQAVATGNNNLFHQAMDLADSVLGSLRNRTEYGGSDEEDAAETEWYATKRHAIIKKLLDAKQYEMAAVLAEKYLDFKVLLMLCEITKNQQRLERYMQLFADQGFRQFAYQWYLQEGKRGQLLSEPTLLRQDDLREFLRPHQDISWLMDVRDGKCDQASRTLQQLAEQELDLLSSKKTLCSLSKLCALASEDSEETMDRIQDLNQELDLIQYQETLPSTVVESQGWDPDRMRVLTPQELIEFYIGDGNSNANEFDFKKALDLLHFVPKDDYYKFQLHIWCRAILRNRWDEIEMDTEDLMTVLKETVFLRTVELSYSEGLDLKDVLPGVDDLLESQELSSLADNSAFKYIMRAGYEQLMRG